MIERGFFEADNRVFVLFEKVEVIVKGIQKLWRH